MGVPEKDDSSSGFVTPPAELSQLSTPAETEKSSQTSTTTASNLDSTTTTTPTKGGTANISEPLSRRPQTPQPTGPIRIPFPHPLPECKPIERSSLTAEQKTKYNTLLNFCRSLTEIPTSTAKNAPTAPIEDNERMWLTHECLLRYLRAVSWSSADAAAKRLLTTLAWRREFDVKGIVENPERVAIESETGKQYVLGYDINARPCLYMQPGRQNTQKSHRQIEHLVFMLESVITMADPGQDMTALLISFKNSTSGGSPSVAQGRQVLGILQGHYPERLGRALISNLPWYISTFFKLISPFIDPVTKEKMVFNEELRKYVPPSQLDKGVGGDADFEYVHEVYWPALCRMCRERRERMKQAWISMGKEVGEFEAAIRGADVPSRRQVDKSAEAAA